MNNYYWSGRSTGGLTLEEMLLSCREVLQINIASAFLSETGVNILIRMKEQYKLQKENIVLYLSAEFSNNSPHLLLEKLNDVCITYIVTQRNFHAKVYFLEGKKESLLLFGSSNFTNGGFSKNVEFNFVKKSIDDDFKDCQNFFNFCEGISTLVTADIINYYSENSSTIFDIAEKKMS